MYNLLGPKDGGALKACFLGGGRLAEIAASKRLTPCRSRHRDTLHACTQTVMFEATVHFTATSQELPKPLTSFTFYIYIARELHAKEFLCCGLREFHQGTSEGAKLPGAAAAAEGRRYRGQHLSSPPRPGTGTGLEVQAFCGSVWVGGSSVEVGRCKVAHDSFAEP